MALSDIQRIMAERAAADANWARLTQTPFDQMGPSRPFTPAQQVGVNAVLAQSQQTPFERMGVSRPFTATQQAAVNGLLRGTPPPFNGTVATPPPFNGLVGAARQGFQTIAPGMWQAGNVEGAALGPGRIATGGLTDAARSAFRSGGVARTPLRFGGIGGAAATIGGNLLDESQLLGGQESLANDATSKMLKWGGAGAALGTIIPGLGTVTGGLIGAGIGLGHEGLERFGVLGSPSKQDQIDTTIHEAEAVAMQTGLPPQVVDQYKRVFDVQKRFAENKDERLLLAQEFANNIEQEAVMYATDPAAYMNAIDAADPEADARRQMAMQALMVNTVKPYADQYQMQSEATAQALENMAAGAGDLAPMYEQQAAQQRQTGTMYASNLVQAAQITPYQQAAEQQAQYLKQIANQTMSSAIGQVMSPQAPAAGSTDLTAIIDANTNALQPN